MLLHGRRCFFLFANVTAILSFFRHADSESSKRDSYIAAVVEYQPIRSVKNDKLAQTSSDLNADKYVEFIQEAKAYNADIVVFPEYGLTSLAIPTDRFTVRPFLVSIPHIGGNPCFLPDSNPILRKLSCAARTHGIYVVINLGEIQSDCRKRLLYEGQSTCQDEDVCHYNTNIVFNSNGEIVAKYHKFHLYFEDQFNAPPVPEYATFKTDFGVTFGTFICFDIMFQYPVEDYIGNGIRNFVFPTAWVDELPFLTATQSNAHWAMSANANILVSGYHEPTRGRLGSGIFSGSAGPLNYTFDPSSGSKLVIAEVPITPFSAPIKVPKAFSKELRNPAIHFLLKEDLRNYSTTVLGTRNASETKNCYEDFCCSFKYAFKAFKKSATLSDYRLIAFSGFRKTAKETAEFGWEVCGVMRCLNETLASCTEVNRSADRKLLPSFTWFELFTTSMEVSQPMKPSLNTLDTHFQPIPYGRFKFTRKEGLVKAVSSTLCDVNVQTIALINRIYHKSETPKP